MIPVGEGRYENKSESGQDTEEPAVRIRLYCGRTEGECVAAVCGRKR